MSSKTSSLNGDNGPIIIISERELTYVHVRYMLSSVRLSVCRLSVTFVYAPYSGK